MGLIHELLPKVMTDIGEIHKGQKNKQFNFDFRGIDDALNACGPVLAKHAVSVSVVCKGCRSEVTMGKNDKGQPQRITRAQVNLAVTFMASDGSYVENILPAEAIDYGSDKAINKALASAMKYALFFGLVLPVNRRAIDDQDRDDDDDDTFRHPEPEEEATGKKQLTKPTDGDADKKPTKRRAKGEAGDQPPGAAVDPFVTAMTTIKNSVTIPKLVACHARVAGCRTDGTFKPEKCDELDEQIIETARMIIRRRITNAGDVLILNECQAEIDECSRQGIFTPADTKALGVDLNSRAAQFRQSRGTADEGFADLGVDELFGPEPWNLPD